MVDPTDSVSDLPDLPDLDFLDVDKDLVCLDRDLLGLLAFAAALDPVDLDFFGFRFERDSCCSNGFSGCSGCFEDVLFQSTTWLSTSVVSRDFDTVFLDRLRGGLDLRAFGDLDGSFRAVSLFGLDLRDFPLSRRDLVGRRSCKLADFRRLGSDLRFTIFRSSSDLHDRSRSCSEESIGLI